jgi:hypothetical protein
MLAISESGILEKGVTFCIIKCIIFAFTFTFRLQSPSLLEKKLYSVGCKDIFSAGYHN